MLLLAALQRALGALADAQRVLQVVLDARQALDIGIRAGERAAHLGAGHLEDGDQRVELAQQPLAILGRVELRIGVGFVGLRAHCGRRSRGLCAMR